MRVYRLFFCRSFFFMVFLFPLAAFAEYAMIGGTPVTQGQMRVAQGNLAQIRSTPSASPDRFVLKETNVKIDLELDFGGLEVRDVLPQPLPDLFADRPLVIMGRYDKPGQGEITLRGNTQGTPIESKMTMTLPEKEEAHDCLGALWARNKIRQIWNRDLGRQTPEGKGEITQLGLAHQLVTRYTSFIAVEEMLDAEPQGRLRSEQVQVRLPADMDRSALGEEISRQAVSSPAGKVQLPVFSGNDTSSFTSQKIDLTGDELEADDNSYDTPSRRGSGGGGGAIEWLYLICLGGLLGGRFLCRKRSNK